MKGLKEASKDGNERKDERRLLPRLNLGSEQFKLTQNGKIYPLMDLSQGGMGFWIIDPADCQIFSVVLELEGHLNLRRIKYPIKARIRYLSKDRVGCEFENLSSTVKDAITQFLDPVSLGKELRPLPANEIRNTLWYHGPTGTDLLYKRSADGHYRQLTIYVLGSYVHWEETEGLSTGRCQAADQHSEVRGILRLETLVMEADPAPDSGKLSIAKTLILSSNLPLELKTWSVRQLER